jgi:hypothetical protein
MDETIFIQTDKGSVTLEGPEDACRAVRDIIIKYRKLRPELVKLAETVQSEIEWFLEQGDLE